MKNNVQQKMQSATDKLSNSVKIEMTIGVGIGAKVKVGTFGVGAEVSGGPQAKVSVNAGGEVKANSSIASVEAKISTPLGDAKAGTSVGNIKVENGEVTTSVVESGASIQPSVSKKVSDGTTSTKVEANSSGDVSFGVRLGYCGVTVVANAVNLFNGMLEAFKAVIEFKKEEIKESSSNPLINKNVYRGPGN